MALLAMVAQLQAEVSQKIWEPWGICNLVSHYFQDRMSILPEVKSRKSNR